MQDLMTELRGETSRDNQPTNKNDGNKVTNETRRSSQAERKRSLRHVFNHISGLRVKTFNSGGKNVKDSPEGSSDPEFRSSILCGVIKIS